MSIPDLLLHVASFARIPAEHEKSGRQSIESVNGAQVPQVVLLGEDEDHSVVTIATARMNLNDKSIHIFEVCRTQKIPYLNGWTILYELTIL